MNGSSNVVFETISLMYASFGAAFLIVNGMLFSHSRYRYNYSFSLYMPVPKDTVHGRQQIEQSTGKNVQRKLRKSHLIIMLNEFHQPDQLQYLPDLLVNIYDLHSPVLTPQLLKKKQKASNSHG